MTDPVFGNEEIKFPVQCYFKVIAESSAAGMKKSISEALAALDIAVPIEGGNQSSGAHYDTYNMSILVQTKQEMSDIDAALRKISGVRMVF